MQPILAVLAVSFIAGLSIRTWNAFAFLLVAMIALAAAGVLYRLDGYM